MCHQSVGLIARHIEAAGFPTIGLTSARSITARANPPRSVLLDVPLGHTSGPPNDPSMQLHIVRSALDAGASMDGPGMMSELDLRWHHDDWKSDPLGWSRQRDGATRDSAPAGDTRTGRSSTPHYQSNDDRDAAEGVDFGEHCLTCIGISDPSADTAH